jgi:hypothetical protein
VKTEHRHPIVLLHIFPILEWKWELFTMDLITKLHRVFIYFKEGEHVFLKLKVKRSSLRIGSFQKLAAIYYGPFEILENTGIVTYMIELHASMRVNNVFHV